MSFNFPGFIHFCTATFAGYTANSTPTRMNGFSRYVRKIDKA